MPEGRTQAYPAQCLDAVVVESVGTKTRLRSGTQAHFGEEMIFHPAPDAEKGQVMAMFRAPADFTKKAQACVGIRAMAQVPPEIEQLIHLFARYRSGFREQIIDDLHRAPKTAGRRFALEVRTSRTSG